MGMDVQFEDELYDRLETDAKFVVGFPGAVVSMYRRRLQQIRSAVDERDLYALKSLRLEKLKGDRSHQHSMRLNDQWRLIIEIHGKGLNKVIIIIGIEDYH
jgi:proteic killer suppression protein